jgi:D-xylose transport system permease protein
MAQDTSTVSSGAPGGQPGFERDRPESTVSGALRAYVDRVRGGDLGALPAVLGIIVLCILFTALRPNVFPTPINFANLLVQAVPITLLAMGLVFVLLLGEIDLSAGVVSGVCAAVLAQSLAVLGAPWYIAVLLALGVGAVIGLITGSLVGMVGIPSFVVTLALFLAWQGVTLRLIGQGGTIPIRNPVIVGLTNANLPVVLGWLLAVLTVVAYAAINLNRWRVQKARGLDRQPLALVVAKVVLIGVIVLAVTAILSVARALARNVVLAGIPYAVPLVVILLLVLTFLLSRTAFGRHIYAVGGNAEAARRAGINVTRIRVAVFVIGSTMAAVSGIAAASRLSSVTPDAGAGNTLLYAVGAAVIGGTSLFGGRGRVVAALLGGLVIATIANGLSLIGSSASTQLIVTGIILLAAVTLDTVSRRRLVASGR